MKTKNIFITLNDVVRNIDAKFQPHYQRYLEEIQMEIDYEVVDTKATGKLKHNSFDLSNLPLDADVENMDIELPQLKESIRKNRQGIRPDYNSRIIWSQERFDFEDKGDFDNFLFSDHAFDIFGRADETYKNSIYHLNELFSNLIAENTVMNEEQKNVLETVNVTILSLERDISKPATLFFLSKNKFLGSNIKFVYDYSQVWEFADAIITANPYIIDTKKKRKKVYKINTPYNKEFKANASFDSIEELLKDKKALKIFN
jgi:hypothetical protein